VAPPLKEDFNKSPLQGSTALAGRDVLFKHKITSTVAFGTTSFLTGMLKRRTYKQS